MPPIRPVNPRRQVSIQDSGIARVSSAGPGVVPDLLRGSEARIVPCSLTWISAIAPRNWLGLVQPARVRTREAGVDPARPPPLSPRTKQHPTTGRRAWEGVVEEDPEARRPDGLAGPRPISGRVQPMAILGARGARAFGRRLGAVRSNRFTASSKRQECRLSRVERTAS